MKCDSRFLTERALALEWVYDEVYQSKITLIEGVRFSKLSPIELLNNACLLYGSSKKGRIDAAKSSLALFKKSPFMIQDEIGVLPTMSSAKRECSWIFNHRFEVEDSGKGRALVTFLNGATVIVNCSKQTLLKQELKLHTLISKNMFIRREKELYT